MPMPTLSQNLEQSLSRALALAKESRHDRATPEHLLLALIDDPDAAAVMRGCDVDRDRLRRDLIAHLESAPERLTAASSEDSKPDAAFHRVIQRAVVHVQPTGREEMTGTDVLVAVLDERDSQAAALMRQQGTTRYNVTCYLSHGIAGGHSASHEGSAGPGQAAMPVEAEGSLARVLLLNDEYTTMEFVVDILRELFDYDHEAATRIMFETHNHGSGICGIYPYDEAVAKVTEVLEIAREHQHPLRCVLERSKSI
jgi:ATP-dependent Clp protease adapter protein ClpS